MAENGNQESPLATDSFRSRLATNEDLVSAEAEKSHRNPGQPAYLADQKFHSAIHEAAHAVVASWFGGWVNHEGVEIEGVGAGTRDRVGLRFCLDQYNEEVAACVNCAGWQAELKVVEDRAWAHTLRRSDDRLADAIEACRNRDHDPEDWEEWGDDGDTFAHILAEHPTATDAEAIAIYRKYETLTDSILARPDIWAAIEALAARLLVVGKLTRLEVDELVHQVSPALDEGYWRE